MTTEMSGATVSAAAVVLLLAACGKSRGTEGNAGDSAAVVSTPSATAPGAPRRGMVWIPAGVLRAGSAVDDVPRVADAELQGVEVPMGGFYIGVLPWPNEAGAIATTNVTRQKAHHPSPHKAHQL